MMKGTFVMQSGELFVTSVPSYLCTFVLSPSLEELHRSIGSMHVAL